MQKLGSEIYLCECVIEKTASVHEGHLYLKLDLFGISPFKTRLVQ